MAGWKIHENPTEWSFYQENHWYMFQIFQQAMLDETGTYRVSTGAADPRQASQSFAARGAGSGV